MARDLIEINYSLSIEDLKDAVDKHLMYKEIYNRETETLEFEIDSDGNVTGAKIKVWL